MLLLSVGSVLGAIGKCIAMIFGGILILLLMVWIWKFLELFFSGRL